MVRNPTSATCLERINARHNWIRFLVILLFPYDTYDFVFGLEATANGDVDSALALRTAWDALANKIHGVVVSHRELRTVVLGSYGYITAKLELDDRSPCRKNGADRLWAKRTRHRMRNKGWSEGLQWEEKPGTLSVTH
jgi:hypothetical protein